MSVSENQTLTKSVIAVLVAIIVIGVVLVPLVNEMAGGSGDTDRKNEGAYGVDLGYYGSTDSWPAKTVTVSLSRSAITLSGDYTASVSASDNGIIAISDKGALYAKNGSLIWYDGTSRSFVSTLTLTLTEDKHFNGNAVSWVYFPETDGAFASYSGTVSYDLSDIVAVGDFAGLVLVSDNKSIVGNNPYNMQAEIRKNADGQTTGVDYKGGRTETSVPDGSVTVADDSDETVLEDSSVGGITYSVSGTEATVTGVENRSATSLTIPETVTIDGTKYYVTAIGNAAFADMTSLITISLPVTLETIGYGAFRGCTSLALTELPFSVTTIEGGAFSGCDKLALTELPPSLHNIGSYAFFDCPWLKVSAIPASVEGVGDGAFQGCTYMYGLVIVGSPSFGYNAIPTTVKEVLNFGSTELTPAMGLADDAVVSDHMSSLAVVQQKESHGTGPKEGIVYTLLLLIPVFMMLAVLTAISWKIFRKSGM